MVPGPLKGIGAIVSGSTSPKGSLARAAGKKAGPGGRGDRQAGQVNDQSLQEILFPRNIPNQKIDGRDWSDTRGMHKQLSNSLFTQQHLKTVYLLNNT